MNYFSDEREWQYLFRNSIDWKTILPLYKGATESNESAPLEETISFYEDILSTVGKWSAESLAPRARELDEVGGGTLVDGAVQLTEPLRKSYQEAKELDLFGLAIHPRFGGMGLPASVSLVSLLLQGRACVATSIQLGFYPCIADMIERFCDSDLQEKHIPRIRAGEISGSMCITEPNAGSDVGSLRMSATPTEDGQFLLNGTKCFITNAGGGLHLVLARIQGAPAGLDGISMFLAEEWIEDGQGKKIHNYKIAKIEDKMALHGSPTCEVVYENTLARLVGKENEGFKMMLHLMNEARISVGLQCQASIEACLAAARSYAEERKQFGKPIIELPLLKRLFQDWETERDAYRAFLVDTISFYDIYQKLHLKKTHTQELSQQENELFRDASRVVRRRTPLVKYYGSEANATLSQRAIQAFGGYGFMKEYEVERFHRESFGALLYEGTSQIQALMAMKDFIKGVLKDPTKFVQSLVTSHPVTSMAETEFRRSFSGVNYEFRKNVAILLMRCFKPELKISEFGFMDTLGQINKVFRKEYWQEEGRFDKLLVHSETLCQALSYKEILNVLSKQATKDKRRGDLYYRYLKLVTPRLAAIYSDWKQ